MINYEVKSEEIINVQKNSSIKSSLSSSSTTKIFNFFSRPSKKFKKNYEKNKLFLYFNNTSLENEYLEFLYGKNCNYIKFCFVFAPIIAIALLILDSQATDRMTSFVYSNSIISYFIWRVVCVVISIPICFAFLLFSNFISKRLFETILFFSLCLLLLCLTMCGVATNAFPVLNITLLTVSSFLKMRFILSFSYLVAIFFQMFCCLVYFFSPIESSEQLLFSYIIQSAVLCVTFMAIIVRVYFEQSLSRRKFENQKELEISNEKIQIECERELLILRNIFPEFLINDLSCEWKEMPIVKTFLNACVVMGDIVSFTTFTSNCSSKFLIKFLNQIYSKFDEISRNYNIEKVKTIGDCYFCCTLNQGNESSHNNANRSILASLEMVKQFQSICIESKVSIQIRFGIGLGTIYLTVMGEEMYSLDCFGEAVNEANIMESNSKPNCIFVSKNVFEKTRRLFKYESYCKNLNSEEAFFVRGVKDKKTFTVNYQDDDVIYHSTSVENEKKGERDSLKRKSIELSRVKKNNDIVSNKVLIYFKKRKDRKEYANDSYNYLKPYLRSSHFLVFILHLTSIFLTYFIGHENYKWSNIYFIFFSLNFLYLCFAIINSIFSFSCWISLIFSYFSVVYSSIFGISLMFFKLFLWLNQSNTKDFINYKNGRFFFVYTNLCQLSIGFSQALFPNVNLIFTLISMLSVLIPSSSILIFVFVEFGSEAFMLLANVILPNYALIFLSLVISLYSFQYNSKKAFCEKQKLESKKDLLKHEKKQNEYLLQSSLPLSVIKSLLIDPKSKTYENVNNGNVAMIKIKGFKIVAAKNDKNVNTSNEHLLLLKVLNSLFTMFDSIITNDEKAFVSKIKSHFYNYLVVTGIMHAFYEQKSNLDPMEHKLSLLKSSITMLRVGMEIIKDKYNLQNTLSITIGCHTGNFSAGIVGSSRLLYDVFGSSICIAERLAHTSEGNKIHVSENFVKDLEISHFHNEKTTFLKGKGETKTFYVKTNPY